MQARNSDSTPGKWGLRLPLVAFVSLLVFWGCAAPTLQRLPQAVPPAGTDIEQQLRRAARDWQGTPYRLGGSSTAGVDCSGLVVILFRDLFDLDLPRVTQSLVQSGTAVTDGRFQAGDLLFFQDRGKRRHVGVYLGRGEFVHASQSRGVMISQLHTAYWQPRLWKVRRLLVL